MVPVMVKTFLGQPIIRLCDGVKEGKAVIRREAGNAVWLANKRDVFVLDKNLFDAMSAYDEQLDDEPEELSWLWAKASPYFPMG